MFTLSLKPSATPTAAAALLLVLMVAAASSVESADCTSLYRTCRAAVISGRPGLATDTCCDGLDRMWWDCSCEVLRKIRADGLNEGAVWCFKDASCPQSSVRGSDDSSSST